MKLSIDTPPPPLSSALAYLGAHKWQQIGTDGMWARFQRPNDSLELEVPLMTEARDFTRRLLELIENLSIVEKRPIRDVLADIHGASTDVMRLAIQGGSTRDGRIPVEAGHRVFSAARDLLLSAACSVLDPRADYAARKSDKAMELLRKARFGQTEIGSFVVTVECAVAPRLQEAIGIVNTGDPNAPFERQTGVLLARALHAIAGATRESAGSGSIEPFRSKIRQGVSANLCVAIAEIFDATDAEDIRTTFSFASCRPLIEDDVPKLVTIAADTAPILREAAASLREEASYPDTELVGTIVKLDRPDASVVGKVVVRADYEGRMRDVHLSLDDANYHLAIAAHENFSLVRCVGELAREARSLVLRHPRDFGVIVADD